MAFRHGAAFVLDARGCSTPLDRNQRARLLFLAEQIERASKGRGKRNGVLGYVGLAVLRCLLLRFHNSRTGLCCPSYDTMQRATGLCRQSITNGLQRLVAVGILGVVRRLARVAIDGIVRCQQGTNLYRFTMPAGRFIPMPMPSARKAPRPAAPMLRGMIGELANVIVGRESMGQGETYKPGQNPLPRPTKGEPDWRSTARKLLSGAMR